MYECLACGGTVATKAGMADATCMLEGCIWEGSTLRPGWSNRQVDTIDCMVEYVVWCGIAACIQDDNSMQDDNSIAGVASWQLSAPARSSSTARAGMWRRRRCDQGWTNLLERAQLLTPDPRLHLLGERADLQKSVCLSMLVACLSMQHDGESVEAQLVCDGQSKAVGLRNAGTIVSRPPSIPPDLTGIPYRTTTAAPSHPSMPVEMAGGVRRRSTGESGESALLTSGAGVGW